MGIFSKFEGAVENRVEGAADKLVDAPLSPVQIAKKAEKQMRKNKMVGAGKQYAPTLYTVLVNAGDDERLFGYYPTLAGEIETYLSAKANEQGLVMDGQPLVRFIVDDGLKHGKFDVIAEMVAAPLIVQLRQEEMEYYGISAPANARGVSYQPVEPEPAYDEYGYDDYAEDDYGYDEYAPEEEPYGEPQTIVFGQEETPETPLSAKKQTYLYDVTNDRAYTLTKQGRTLVGRESNNHVVIEDINVSRLHAELRCNENGQWVITDLGSTNGTFVNNRRVKSSPLRDADQLTLGTTKLEFQQF